LYYRDANGAVLVFDLTIRETFQKVEKWVEELKIFNKEIDIVIAGNKADLNKYDVDRDELNKYACDNKFPIVLTSAKTGEGVQDVFDSIFKKIAKRFSNGKFNDKKKGLTFSEDEDINKAKGCC